jgi:hypothetical protein
MRTAGRKTGASNATRRRRRIANALREYEQVPQALRRSTCDARVSLARNWLCSTR